MEIAVNNKSKTIYYQLNDEKKTLFFAKKNDKVQQVFQVNSDNTFSDKVIGAALPKKATEISASDYQYTKKCVENGWATVPFELQDFFIKLSAFEQYYNSPKFKENTFMLVVLQKNCEGCKWLMPYLYKVAEQVNDYENGKLKVVAMDGPSISVLSELEFFKPENMPTVPKVFLFQKGKMQIIDFYQFGNVANIVKTITDDDFILPNSKRKKTDEPKQEKKGEEQKYKAAVTGDDEMQLVAPFQDMAVSEFLIFIFFPAAYTPVCGSELGLYSDVFEELSKRYKIRMFGVSDDNIETLIKYVNDTENGVSVKYSLLANGINIAAAYGQIEKGEDDKPVVGRGITILRKINDNWTVVYNEKIYPNAARNVQDLHVKLASINQAIETGGKCTVDTLKDVLKEETVNVEGKNYYTGAKVATYVKELIDRIVSLQS